MPWVQEFLLFVTVPIALVWPAGKLIPRVFAGLMEEKDEWSRRREQYAEEARRAWANAADLDEARGTFWQSLFSDGRSRSRSRP
jgi:hypothetical protein